MKAQLSVTALRVEGHRLIADGHAKLAEAEALECSPRSDELLTAKTWPDDLPCTFRTAKESGAIQIHKAGRRPCMRRADVLAWIASRTSRTFAPKAAPPASEDDDAPDLVRGRGERVAR